MKGKLWLGLAVFLLIAAAIFLAPVSAGTQGQKGSKGSVPTTVHEAQVPQCSQVPVGREIEPPDPGQPLPGCLGTSFCSQHDGIRCVVSGQFCNGKCKYVDLSDGTCTQPDPVPPSWGCGCT
jgi:hypothetical protein